MLGHKGRKSTMYAVLVVSVVASLFISFFSNLLNFNFIRRVMDREMLDSQRTTSSLAFDNIEEQLDAAIRANAMIMIGSDELQHAVIADNANFIRYSIRTLSNIIETVPAIASFDVYIPNLDCAIVNSSHISYEVSENKRCNLLPWLDDFLSQDKKFLLLPEGTHNYPEYRSNITYIAAMPSPFDGLLSLAAIHIDPSLFGRYINENNGDFLILDKNHQLIYQTPGADHYETALEEIQKHDNLYETTSYAISGSDGRMFISMKSASLLNLDFIYIAESVLTNHFMPYLQSFILNSIILIVMNLLVISVVAFKNDSIYRNRIKMIVSGEKSDNAIRSSFDQLSDELERKFININSSYEDAQPIVIQNKLRMIMLGRAEESDMEGLDELLPYDSLRIAIVRRAADSVNGDMLSSMLAQELENLPQDVICYMTTIRNETIIVVNSYADSFGFTSLLNEDTDLKLFLSNRHDVSADNLREAYVEATQVLPYSFMYPDMHRLSYSRIAPGTRKSEVSSDRYLTRFDESLHMQTSADVTIEMLSSIIKSLIESDVTIDYCKVVIRDLVTILHKNIINQGIDPIGFLGYDIRQYYEQIEDINGYEAWMKVCLTNYFGYLEEIRQSRIENRMKEQIDAILKEGPANMLSLDYIATKMNMRADELSRLFKTCYGINYSEYIKDMKMEYAKKLLAEGMKVKDISSVLGYNAPQYFIKVFKQVTGITPNQYGKLMKSEGGMQDE